MAVSLLVLSPWTQAAMLSSFGAVTTTQNGIFDFSVDQTSSYVTFAEFSLRDFRLGIFDSFESLVASNDDCWGSCLPGQNVLDSMLNLTLNSGNYTAVVSSWTNYSTTLDGYGLNDRRGLYLLKISGDGISAGHSVAAVPEPGILALIGIGFIGIVFARKNREKFGDYSKLVASA